MPRKVKLNKTVVVNLIAEVSRRPCIWDVDNIYYKDRRKILRAWHSIANQLAVEEDVLRAKWRNLRDTLNRELKKYNMKTGDKYPGMWRYFNRLHFLHKHFSAKFSEDEDYNRTNAIMQDTMNADIYANESDDATLYDDQNIPEAEYVDIKDNLSKPIQEDFDLLFLNSLLPFFHELEPHRKLRVRSQIQELILHELTDKKFNIDRSEQYTVKNLKKK